MCVCAKNVNEISGKKEKEREKFAKKCQESEREEFDRKNYGIISFTLTCWIDASDGQEQFYKTDIKLKRGSSLWQNFITSLKPKMFMM